MADREFGFETLCLHAGQIPDAADRLARGADLPDDVVRVRQRRPRGEPLQPADVRQRLLAHLESDRRRCSRSASRRSKAGAPRWRPPPGRPREMIALLTLLQQRRPHRRRRRTLYGGTLHACSRVNFAQARHRHDVRRSRRSGEFPPRAQAEHQGDLRRDDRQSRSINVIDIAAIADDRARGRRAARRRQHAGLALPVPADRARRRHRRAFGDQVPRRPRHDHGRRRRRDRQVPVGQRQVPADDRALARLPRRALLRDLRRLRLHDEGAHGDRCARLGPTLSPFNAWLLLQGIETLHVRMDRALRQSRWPSRSILAAHPKVDVGELPGPAGSPYHALAKRYLPKGAGALLTFGVKGGVRGRREVHRGAAVHARTSPTSATRRRS